jgi:hypothetical protein
METKVDQVVQSVGNFGTIDTPSSQSEEDMLRSVDNLIAAQLMTLEQKVDAILDKTSQWQAASSPIKRVSFEGTETPVESAAGSSGSGWGNNNPSPYQPRPNPQPQPYQPRVNEDDIADRVYERLVNDYNLSDKVANSIYEKLMRSGLLKTASNVMSQSSGSSGSSGYRLNPGERIIAIDGVPVGEMRQSSYSQPVYQESSYAAPMHMYSGPVMSGPTYRSGGLFRGGLFRSGGSVCGPGGCN